MCTEGVRDGDVAASPPSREWTARPRHAPRALVDEPHRRGLADVPHHPRVEEGRKEQEPKGLEERRKETNQQDDAPCTPGIHPCWSPINPAAALGGRMGRDRVLCAEPLLPWLLEDEAEEGPLHAAVDAGKDGASANDDTAMIRKSTPPTPPSMLADIDHDAQVDSDAATVALAQSSLGQPLPEHHMAHVIFSHSGTSAPHWGTVPPDPLLFAGAALSLALAFRWHGAFFAGANPSSPAPTPPSTPCTCASPAATRRLPAAHLRRAAALPRSDGSLGISKTIVEVRVIWLMLSRPPRGQRGRSVQLGESSRSSNFISARLGHSRPRLHSGSRCLVLLLARPLSMELATRECSTGGGGYASATTGARLSNYRPEARARKTAHRVDLPAPTPPCWALDFRGSGNSPAGLAHQLVPPPLTRPLAPSAAEVHADPESASQSCTPPTARHSDRLLPGSAESCAPTASHTPHRAGRMQHPPPAPSRQRNGALAARGSAQRQVPRGATLSVSQVKSTAFSRRRCLRARECNATHLCPPSRMVRTEPIRCRASAGGWRGLHTYMPRSPRGVSSKVGREQRCAELASDARVEITAQRFARAPDPVHLGARGCVGGAGMRSTSVSAPSSPPTPSLSAWKPLHGDSRELAPRFQCMALPESHHGNTL
ncbi:hypothetical protein DFH09DRAFT_1414186 [Mycena vulgaris]|nr:hypothetical protein DFH09DRAFT_1414186 [Mycena vulgaris]